MPAAQLLPPAAGLGRAQLSLQALKQGAALVTSAKVLLPTSPNSGGDTGTHRARCCRQDMGNTVRVMVVDLLTTCELLSADTINMYDPLKNWES